MAAEQVNTHDDEDPSGILAAYAAHAVRWDREFVTELRADIPRLAKINPAAPAMQLKIIATIKGERE
jgi:hypothetical protein